MKWFKHKNLKKAFVQNSAIDNQGTGHKTQDTNSNLVGSNGGSNGRDPVRPYPVDRHSSPNRSFLYTLLVLLIVFCIPAALVQGASVLFTQSDWNTEIPGSLATTPFGTWDEYSAKDTGVVVGSPDGDIHLEPVNYTLTQTSDDGAADTCTAAGCSTAGGFNAGTRFETVVYGTGTTSKVMLSKTIDPIGTVAGNNRINPSPSVNPEQITAIVLDGTHVYTAGFDAVAASGGEWRIEKRSAAGNMNYDPVFGSGTGFIQRNQNSNSERVNAMAIDGGFIYAAGYSSLSASDEQWQIEKYDTVNGVPVAVFNTGGTVLSNPNVGAGSEQITAIAVDATYIYVAGYENSIGGGDEQWRIEKRLKSTGALETTNFDPGNGFVVSNPLVGSGLERITAMAVDATDIYVAGFDNVPLNSQWRIEKRDISSGQMDGVFGGGSGFIQSNPSAGGPDEIRTIAIDGTYIYVAGFDTSVGAGDEQWRIEKRDKITGNLETTNFNPGNGYVVINPQVGAFPEKIMSIAIDGDYIFAAGYSSQGGSEQFWRIENRDIVTGNFTAWGFGTGSITIGYFPWVPAASGINAVAFDDKYVYMGGFSKVAGSDYHLRVRKHYAKVFKTGISGTFESTVMDLGGIQDFNIFRWTPPNPLPGTTLTINVQASVDSVSWGPWTPVTSDVDTGTTFDGNKYFRYEATFSTTNSKISPRLEEFVLDFSNFPVGVGLVSSIFDTGDQGNFLQTISWTEIVSPVTDIRLQIATSADNISWNYCGSDICSPSGWLNWSNANNYYDSGNLTHLQSSDAVDDRYFQYKVWLVSDGTETPTVDDIIVTYDSASLYVFAPDGTSSTYVATAGTPFGIVLKARDSNGTADVTDHGDVAPITVKFTASVPQPDVGACISSFTDNGNTEFTKPFILFSSGGATIPNFELCSAATPSFTISAQEISQGALSSTSDLTISAVNPTATTQLVFTAQPPTTVLSTVDFNPLPVVSIKDLIGTVITSNTTAVTLTAWDDSLCSATSASGTFNVTSLGTTAGVATFSNVNYDTPETIYIKAQASGFSDICSNAVAVVGKGYVVQIDPIYDVGAGAIVITMSLLRNGVLITDNANMTLTSLDITDSALASVLTGGLSDPNVTTVTDTANSVYHVAWGPAAGLTPDTTYSIFADITYNGVIYSGFITANVNQLGVVTADIQVLDTKLDGVQTTVSAIETNAQLIDTSVLSLDTKISAHAASQAAYRTQTTNSLAAIVKNIGSILEDTSKTVPDLVKSSISKELAKGDLTEIVTTQAVVTTGAKIPFRFRTASGLKPTVTVFDPKDVAKVSSAAMKEVGGTGIYVYNITFSTSWGLGNFMVRVNETTKQSVDHIVLHVTETSDAKALAKKTINKSAITLDTLYSRINKINSSMDTLATGVDAVKSNTENVGTDISGLLDSMGGSTGSSTVAAADVQKFETYINSVSSIIGSSGSSTDFKTIMGKLNGIEDTLSGMGDEAIDARNFNQSAKEKAERIKRFVTIIMTELKEEGSVKDPEAKVEILDDYLTELKETVEGIPESVTTGVIAESVDHTLKELNEITIRKEGLEGLMPLVKQDLGEGVIDIQRAEDLTPTDMMDMRNDVSGLKSLMLEIRELLDTEVNQPVVHGWLEGE